MSCPGCSTNAAELEASRRRIAELEARVAARDEQLRRCRERVAVLIGRTAAALDVLDEQLARAEAEHG